MLSEKEIIPYKFDRILKLPDIEKYYSVKLGVNSKILKGEDRVRCL